MIRAAMFWVIIIAIAAIVTIQLPVLAIHFIACLLLSVSNTRFSRYGLNGFLAWDQALNAILAPVWRWIFKYPRYDFGYADETISSVLGKNIRFNPKGTDKSVFLVDKVLSRLDPTSRKHSIDSIEIDEGTR